MRKIFGKRKNGQFYPKSPNITKQDLIAVKQHKGTMVEIGSGWKEGHKQFSGGYSKKYMDEIVAGRTGRNKKQEPRSQLTVKSIVPLGIMEFITKKDGKIIDDFQIKQEKNGLWSIRNMPTPHHMSYRKGDYSFIPKGVENA